MKRVGRTFELAGIALLALSLSGCVRGCPSSRPPIHLNPNMDWQPRYNSQKESAFFYDGKAMRSPVPGTVARGQLDEDAAFVTGKDPSGAPLARLPMATTETLLTRGAQRFDIYCRPCHDARGTGRGILYERGSVPTPAFGEDRLVHATDGEIFDVITHGKGLMPAYGYPIPPADRWAIITRVRVLQREQLARRATAPPPAAAPAVAAEPVR